MEMAMGVVGDAAGGMKKGWGAVPFTLLIMLDG